jgi:ABC-type Zn2+ transport system substrate-binding protein/surface adhesin
MSAVANETTARDDHSHLAENEHNHNHCLHDHNDDSHVSTATMSASIHLLTVWKHLARLAPDQPDGWSFPDALKDWIYVRTSLDLRKLGWSFMTDWKILSLMVLTTWEG